MHRVCRCGAMWLERSAGHAHVDISLDDPAIVAICQHCRTRIPNEKTLNPQCCRTPEVSYHDTHNPCDLCWGATTASAHSGGFWGIGAARGK